MEIPTPRTDTAEYGFFADPHADTIRIVDSSFARKLEREALVFRNLAKKMAMVMDARPAQAQIGFLQRELATLQKLYPLK